MEPIIYNRKNENIALARYMTVDKRFRFNQGAINMMGLRVGKYMHLLEYPENEWYLKINEDKNGIKLSLEGTHMVCHANKLCRFFLAKNRSNINLSKISIESSVSFNLVESSKTHGGDKLFYIDTSKPFKSIRQK